MNREEKDLLRNYEKGEWKSVKDAHTSFKKYITYARATLKKDKRINIRVSAHDLEGIQKKAVEQGLPYQTFIASIIHKFVAGRLRETG
jgi:predicted DNA binding CopG/RHH family protein